MQRACRIDVATHEAAQTIHAMVGKLWKLRQLSHLPEHDLQSKPEVGGAKARAARAAFKGLLYDQTQRSDVPIVSRDNGKVSALERSQQKCANAKECLQTQVNGEMFYKQRKSC